MKNESNIAKRLKAIRQELGLKQNELAKGLDVSNPTISDLESGKYRPNFEIISRFVRRYDVNLYYLYFGTGEMFGEHAEKSTGLLADDFSDSIINQDEFKRFLDHLRRSPFMMLSVLSHYRYILSKESDVINKDLETYEKNHKKDD